MTYLIILESYYIVLPIPISSRRSIIDTMATHTRTNPAEAYVFRLRRHRLEQTFLHLLTTKCVHCRRKYFSSFLHQRRRVRTMAATRSKTIRIDSIGVENTRLRSNTRSQRRPKAPIGDSPLCLPQSKASPQTSTTPPDKAQARTFSSLDDSAAPRAASVPCSAAPKLTQPTLATPSPRPRTPVRAAGHDQTLKLTSDKVSKSWPADLGGQKVRGLRNPHNWCYRRSLLQALACSPQFFNMMDGTHDRCDKIKRGCVTCQLRLLLQVYHGGKPGLQTALTSFDNAIKTTGRRSDPRWEGVGNGQEDSFLFLQYLMGIIENTRARGAEQRAFRDAVKLGHQVTWKCGNCNKIHVKDEPAGYSLQLPIPSQRQQPVTLKNCLDAYHVENGLLITCDKCNTKARRSRRHRITNPPGLLSIQLKRFNMDAYGRTQKNRDHVHYDEVIDLSPWSAESDPSLVYRLQAVVAHSGGLKSGHYVAYVRTAKGVSYISDETVQAETASKWLKPGNGFQPYILFYVKQ